MGTAAVPLHRGCWVPIGVLPVDPGDLLQELVCHPASRFAAYRAELGERLTPTVIWRRDHHYDDVSVVPQLVVNPHGPFDPQLEEVFELHSAQVAGEHLPAVLAALHRGTPALRHPVAYFEPQG